jgi:hypothetical protein
MMTSVNEEIALAELTECHERYERALVNNDVDTLQRFFWKSPHSVRYGVGENLYGADEIDAFRQARSPLQLAREVLRIEIVTFDSDTGVVNLEFRRTTNGIGRHGRQSQFWRRFAEGWRVVSGHISLLPLPPIEEYVAASANLIGLPIDSEHRAGVVEEFSRCASVAAVLLDFTLTEDTELAPVFQP